MSRVLFVSPPPGGSLQDAFRNQDLSDVSEIHFVSGTYNGTPYFDCPNTYHAFFNNKTLDADINIDSNKPLPERTVTNAAGMFDGCSNLSTFPTFAGNFESWRYTQAMFKGCSWIDGFFSMGGNFRPYWMTQMFMGCQSWEGDGLNMLDFSALVSPTGASDLCTNVPVSSRNIRNLCDRIIDTAPFPLVNVNVGCGDGDVLAALKIEQAIEAGHDIVHDGYLEPWDDTFEPWCEQFHARHIEETLDFSGLDLQAQFTSGYNGGLITPSWGVFAAHYQPPVGFTVTAQSGEQFRVVSRHPVPGTDVCFVKFDHAASFTTPMLVWDPTLIHPNFQRGLDLVKELDICFPCFARDQFEKPWVGALGYFSEVGGAATGGVVKHGTYRPFIKGDSGSILFVVKGDEVLNFSVLGGGGGSSSSFSHQLEFLASLTDEPVRLGG